MRIKTIGLTLLASLAPACFGQLTPEQKEQDFNVLAALYAKNYAPYEWKKQALGFDLLRTGPWLARVRQSKTDLDFYDICIEYVASLQDTHDMFSLTSDFLATLNIGLDIYDGKVLIDGINRTRLPLARFPFVIGDEVLTVDGVRVERLLEDFAKYSIQGNPRSTRRFAAARITIRPQNRMPHAAEVGDSATVVVRRMNGDEETYILPWTKSGTPLTTGPVPSPTIRSARGGARIDEAEPEQTEEPAIPGYEKLWRKIQRAMASDTPGVTNYGARNPVYALPTGFSVRYGSSASDFFVSGTYTNSGLRIGYIRIPTYDTLSPVVLAQFDREIAFFQQNTDGLVVDQMRNPGGDLCFGENVARRLIPGEFRPMGYQIRATRSWLLEFYDALQAARAARADQWIIDLFDSSFQQLNQAYSENRGLTGSLPVCAASLSRRPATDSAGRPLVYTKPLLMIVDEFSASTADSVPAMLQDAGRGIIFGWRTNGAGGTNDNLAAGAYSEALVGMTLGIMTRKGPIKTPDYPEAEYIENIGVRPDIEYDYMTRENLLQQGRPFVAAFTEAIVTAIRTGGR